MNTVQNMVSLPERIANQLEFAKYLYTVCQYVSRSITGPLFTDFKGEYFNAVIRL